MAASKAGSGIRFMASRSCPWWSVSYIKQRSACPRAGLIKGPNQAQAPWSRLQAMSRGRARKRSVRDAFVSHPPSLGRVDGGEDQSAVGMS